MQLLQSWKESLLIFKPSYFKLFFLVTVKSTWETYKLLFRYFWWLLLSIVLLDFIKRMVEISYVTSKATEVLLFYYLLNILFFICELIFFYVTILITRSSVEQKKWLYFGRYLFSWYSLFFSLLFLFYFILHRVDFLIRGWKGSLVLDFLGSNIFVFLIFFTLFFLDSAPPSLKTVAVSIGRAIKMIIYNYPFFFVIYVFALLIGFFLLILLIFFLTVIIILKGRLIVMPFLNVIVDVIFKLLFPLYICIFTNFYIKQVHEHFDLYFGKRPSE